MALHSFLAGGSFLLKLPAYMTLCRWSHKSCQQICAEIRRKKKKKIAFEVYLYMTALLSCLLCDIVFRQGSMKTFLSFLLNCHLPFLMDPCVAPQIVVPAQIVVGDNLCKILHNLTPQIVASCTNCCRRQFVLLLPFPIFNFTGDNLCRQNET